MAFCLQSTPTKAQGTRNYRRKNCLANCTELLYVFNNLKIFELKIFNLTVVERVNRSLTLLQLMPLSSAYINPLVASSYTELTEQQASNSARK